MIYEPREITCRDGRSCILRSAAVTDANDLIRYLKVTAGETPFLIREPDEISLTPEQEEHFIEGIVKEPRELMLIGTVAGEHVATVPWCLWEIMSAMRIAAVLRLPSIRNTAGSESAGKC